jgi:hypothetical protein
MMSIDASNSVAYDRRAAQAALREVFAQRARVISQRDWVAVFDKSCWVGARDVTATGDAGHSVGLANGAMDEDAAGGRHACLS